MGGGLAEYPSHCVLQKGGSPDLALSPGIQGVISSRGSFTRLAILAPAVLWDRGNYGDLALTGEALDGLRFGFLAYQIKAINCNLVASL